MKTWTQQDFRGLRPGLDGRTHLPAGDWRAVDFGGRHNLIFPAHCVLGVGAQLGCGCVLGERCEVGGGFHARGNLTVGAYCRFGREANIPAGSRIDRGVRFADAAVFAQEDIDLGDGVEIAGTCRLFGVRGVVGKSLIKIYIHGRSTVYAFETAQGDAYVHTMGATKQLEDFEDDVFFKDEELLAAAEFLRSICDARKGGMNP